MPPGGYCLDCCAIKMDVPMDQQRKLSQASLGEATSPSDSSYVNSKHSEALDGEPSELQKNIQFGQHILGFVTDIADLARIEALIAVKSIPRLLMLWLIMMPVILLTWCSFTVLIAWGIYSITGQIGFGFFSFFLQQVLLLVGCYLLYTKYKKRMTMPYTRKHVNEFLKGFSNEPSNPVGDKKL